MMMMILNDSGELLKINLGPFPVNIHICNYVPQALSSPPALLKKKDCLVSHRSYDISPNILDIALQCRQYVMVSSHFSTSCIQKAR